jgi:hypothetical protein
VTGIETLLVVVIFEVLELHAKLNDFRFSVFHLVLEVFEKAIVVLILFVSGESTILTIVSALSFILVFSCS